jgi:hypothetical protein
MKCAVEMVSVQVDTHIDIQTRLSHRPIFVFKIRKTN